MVKICTKWAIFPKIYSIPVREIGNFRKNTWRIFSFSILIVFVFIVLDPSCGYIINLFTGKWKYRPYLSGFLLLVRTFINHYGYPLYYHLRNNFSFPQGDGRGAVRQDSWQGLLHWERCLSLCQTDPRGGGLPTLHGHRTQRPKTRESPLREVSYTSYYTSTQHIRTTLIHIHYTHIVLK